MCRSRGSLHAECVRESSCWVCRGSLHAGCGEGVFMLGVERESSCWVCVEGVFMLGV